MRVQRRPVGGDEELVGQASLVAGELERPQELRPVKAPLAGRPPVVVAELEVDKPCADVQDRLIGIPLLDVHVERVQHHAHPAAHSIGQRQRLVVPGDEVGLEPVDGLDAAPDLHRSGLLLDPLEDVDAPLPLLLGGAAGRPAADLRRDDAHNLPAEGLDEVEYLVAVLGRGVPNLRLIADRIAPAHHKRHRPPAGKAVLFEKLPDLRGVVPPRLPADLKRVESGFGQAGDRLLDRLGTHPVHARESHGHRSE